MYLQEIYRSTMEPLASPVKELEKSKTNRKVIKVKWKGLRELLIKKYAKEDDDFILSIGHWSPPMWEGDVSQFNAQIKITMKGLRNEML